eukprot:scpid30422/ scgid13035/ 
MDDSPVESGTEVDTSITLSHLLAEVDELPVRTTVVSGVVCGRESLPCQDITVLYVEEAAMAQFRDGHGRSFCESVSLDACRFKLLPEREENDDKTFATVRHVMRRTNCLPNMVRALSGYGLDEVGSEEAVEPNDVFEVGTARLERCGVECVLWFRVNNIGGDGAGAVQSATSSFSSPSREPIAIPLDADCEFHTSVDERLHRLQDVIGMVKKGLLQLPVRLEVASTSTFGLASLPATLVGRKFTITGLPTRRSVIATDGGDVFRIPEELCDTVRVADVLLDTEYSMALRNVIALSRCLDGDRIRTVGPPEAASISALTQANAATPIASSSSAAAGGAGLGGSMMSRHTATQIIMSPQHFRQRLTSQSLRQLRASRSSVTRTRSDGHILHRRTQQQQQQRLSMNEDDEGYVPHVAVTASVSASVSPVEYCTVPERKPSSGGSGGVRRTVSNADVNSMRPAANLPRYTPTPVHTGGERKRADAYEDVDQVRYGYSFLRPGEDRRAPDSRRSSSNTSRAVESGFDDQNYALMSSAAHRSSGDSDDDIVSPQNGGAAGGAHATNLYSNGPRSRDVTHEHVSLAPRVPLKKHKSGSSLMAHSTGTGTSTSSEHIYQTPTSSRPPSPARMSLRSRGSFKQQHAENLYSTPTSSPLPMRKSHSQPQLAQLSVTPAGKQCNDDVIDPPLYVNGGAAEADTAAEVLQTKKPMPKPRRSLTTRALNTVAVRSPEKPCSSVTSPGRSAAGNSATLGPQKPPRKAKTPSETNTLSPTSPLYTNIPDTSGGGAGSGYVQLANVQQISEDLERTKAALELSQSEVQSLQVELSAYKDQCYCMNVERRVQESYEITIPRNLPKSSSQFIGRDSTV